MKINLKVGLVILLVLMQSYLFSKVLFANSVATFLIISTIGLPLAIACSLLVTHYKTWQYLETTLAMFTAGGVGMLIGYLIDIKNLSLIGPFGLMSICRTAAELPLSFESIWFMIKSTPWMYIGMFIAGNIGVLIFEKIQTNKSQVRTHLCDHCLCNIGMLIGMILADVVSIALTKSLDLFWGNAVMIAFMMLGMFIGMIVMLMISSFLKQVFIPSLLKQQSIES